MSELKVKINDVLGKYLKDTPMPEKQAIALVEELDTLLADELGEYCDEYNGAISHMMNTELDKFGIPSEGETKKIEDRTYTSKYTASGRMTLALRELAQLRADLAAAVKLLKTVMAADAALLPLPKPFWNEIREFLARLEGGDK